MNTARTGNFFSKGRTVKMFVEDTDAKGNIMQFEDTICRCADEGIAEFIATACAIHTRNLRKRTIRST